MSGKKLREFSHYKNCIRETMLFLRWGGIEIGKNSLLNLFRRFCAMYCLTVHILFESIQLFYLEREDLAIGLSYLWAQIFGVIVLGQWYKTKHKIIEYMKNVEQMQPDVEDDYELIREIQKDINIKKYLSYTFFTCSPIIMTSGLVGWIIAYFVDRKKIVEARLGKINPYDLTTGRNLPFPIWLPFDYRSSEALFLTSGIYSSCALTVIAFTAVGMMVLFFSLTTFGTIHFKIVNHLFKCMYQHSLRRLSCLNIYQKQGSKRGIELEIEVELKACVIYLNEILKFCSLLEEVYNKLLLVEILLSGMAVACSLAMVKNATMTDGRYFAYIITLFASLYQIFLYCYFGNNLTLSAEKISESIYFNNWIDANKSIKTGMLIIMIRMSKMVNLTIGKFYPIRLSTFVTIVRAGCSFLAVFQKK